MEPSGTDSAAARAAGCSARTACIDSVFSYGHGHEVCDGSSQLLAIIGGSVRFGNGETSRLRLPRVLIDGCEALTRLPTAAARAPFVPPASYRPLYRT